MSTLYTFWDGMIPSGTASVYFFVLMSSTTKEGHSQPACQPSIGHGALDSKPLFQEIPFALSGVGFGG